MVAPAPPPQPGIPPAPGVQPAAPEDRSTWVPPHRLREVSSERDTLLAERNRLAAERETITQDYALFRAGITDPEDMGEFRDRYSRAPAGEDGKKPAFDAWVKAIQTSRPKWALPYLPAPVDPNADPGATVNPATNPAQRQQVPAPPPVVQRPPGDPNGGATTTTTAARTMSDAEITRLRAAGQLRGQTLRTAIEQARAQGLVK